MPYYLENLQEFRNARKIFKTRLDIAYRNRDLPEFIYQYCQWIISDKENPLANMFWLDYNNAINLHQIRKHTSRIKGTGAGRDQTMPPLSDILSRLIPTAAVFIGSTPETHKWNYRQFSPFNIMSLGPSAIETADFREKYMTIPPKRLKTCLSASEKEMAKACMNNDLPGYAWWWSVWTATKDRGHLEGGYWDNSDNISPRALLLRLKNYLALFNTKDRNGQYIYDVFRNPFSDTEHFGTASLPVVRAIQCIEPFYDV